MAVGTLEKLSTRGIRAELQTRIDEIPEWWRPHCTEMESTTQVEPFGWAGSIPQPREMVDGRRIKEIRAFTYDIRNKTYELSVLFPRVWFEDDQIGSIRLRIGEMAKAWRAYKPYLFTYMLEQGGTLTAYDGNTFFHDTRTEGDSAIIDNNLTSVAAADDAIPTAAEFLAQMAIIKAAMRRFQDDQGWPGNLSAMQQLRVIIPGEAEKSVLEALRSTLISNTDNVFGRGLAELDVDDFLTYSATTCTMFVHAVGDSLKGMIHQQRTPMEIIVYDGPEWIDANDGVLVTLRERFVFAYGQFRRMVKQVFTT
jgi:hypothetical protein